LPGEDVLFIGKAYPKRKKNAADVGAFPALRNKKKRARGLLKENHLK